MHPATCGLTMLSLNSQTKGIDNELSQVEYCRLHGLNPKTLFLLFIECTMDIDLRTWKVWYKFFLQGKWQKSHFFWQISLKANWDPSERRTVTLSSLTKDMNNWGQNNRLLRLTQDKFPNPANGTKGFHRPEFSSRSAHLTLDPLMFGLP